MTVIPNIFLHRPVDFTSVFRFAGNRDRTCNPRDVLQQPGLISPLLLGFAWNRNRNSGPERFCLRRPVDFACALLLQLNS